MQDGMRPLGWLRPRRTGTCDASVIVTDAGKAVDPRSVMRGEMRRLEDEDDEFTLELQEESPTVADTIVKNHCA